MAATVNSSSLSMSMSASISSTGGSYTTKTTVSNSNPVTFQNGVAAGNVSKVYDGTFTIASTGSPTTLDLTALTDPQGNAINFSAITGYLIENTSTTASDAFTAGGGTNSIIPTASDKIYNSGGGLMYSTGNAHAITCDATHKLIILTATSGTAVPGKITIFGK